MQLRGLLARSPGAWGPAQRLKCWSEDGNPLSWNCKAPPSETIQRTPRSADWGLAFETQQEVKNSGCRKSGACGPGLQGAWGPGPQGLGPGPPGLHPNPQITIFRKPPGGSLAKAWVSAETAASEVGTWRETKPGSGRQRKEGSATIQHAPQGRRIGGSLGV